MASAYRSAPRCARAIRHQARALSGSAATTRDSKADASPNRRTSSIAEARASSCLSSIMGASSQQAALAQVGGQVVVGAALVGEQRDVAGGIEPGAQRRLYFPDRGFEITKADHPRLAAADRVHQGLFGGRLADVRDGGAGVPVGLLGQLGQVDARDRAVLEVVAEHLLAGGRVRRQD